MESREILPTYVFAVKMVIAEEGTLVAGEAEHRQGNWNGNVNANLARFDSVYERPGCRAVCCEDRRAITVRVSVDDIDGLLGRVNKYAR